MSQRFNYYSHAPEAFKKLQEIEELVRKSSLDPLLIHIVKTRASQLNGCTFCVDMHVKEAMLDKESPLRLHHIAVWEESHLFTEKERAALMWTEAVTHLSVKGTDDSVYQKVREYFNEKELTELTLVITMINTWNRFGVAFRAAHGAMDKQMGLDKAGL